MKNRIVLFIVVILFLICIACDDVNVENEDWKTIEEARQNTEQMEAGQ